MAQIDFGCLNPCSIGIYSLTQAAGYRISKPILS